MCSLFFDIMLIELLACILGTVSLATLLGQPRNTLHYSAVIGLCGYIVFKALNQSFFAYFACGLVIGVLCEIVARITKSVATIYFASGIIPMVPGLTLYKSAEYLVQKDYTSAVYTLIEAFGGIGAIALALTISSLIFLRIRRN